MIISEAQKVQIDSLIDLALAEDIGPGDVTGEAVFSGNETSEAYIISKSKGIFSGSEILKRVFEKIDESIDVKFNHPDGAVIVPGDVVAEIRGSTKSILAGERVALNFIQRMSGISTCTAEFTEIVSGTDISILDTRKTLPGFRVLDKLAVSCAGGTNHRIGLYDMVMIKDNHIKAAGSIGEAVRRVRKKWDRRFPIEVETTCIDEVAEALKAGVDIIMLDNMDRKLMEEAIGFISGKAKIEVSGNMTAEKIRKLKDLKIDYISVGALTHSVEAFDFSMKFK